MVRRRSKKRLRRAASAGGWSSDPKNAFLVAGGLLSFLREREQSDDGDPPVARGQ